MMRLIQMYAVLTCGLLFSACTVNPGQLEPTTGAPQSLAVTTASVTASTATSGDLFSEATPTAPTLQPTQTPVLTGTVIIPTEAPPTATEAKPESPLQERVKEQVTIFYTRPQGGVFPLLAWPPLPILDQSPFQSLYGEQWGYAYLDDYAPQVNADGRYLLTPGVEQPEEGAAASPDDVSTWLVDLTQQTVRELEHRPIFAVWSPDGQQLAYGQGNTLYIEDVNEPDSSRAVFTEPGLDGFFTQWSPDGRELAVISTVIGPSINGAYPPITSTLWLVAAEDGAARPLGSFPLGGREYSRNELQWSPDGSALFSAITQPGYIFTLDGQRIALEEIDRPLAWAPGQSNLLVRQKAGALSLIDSTRQETIYQITDGERRVTGWGFSDDGQYLAYVYQPFNNEPIEVFVFDLARKEAAVVGTVAASIVTSIYWTPKNDVLILNDAGLNTPIWGLDIESGGEAEALLEGTLINAVQSLSGQD